MIRPFSPSDLNAILQIESHSFPKSPYTGTTFLQFYLLHPDTFLVCCDVDRMEEEILGYVIFTHEGHVISIAVHPQHRRKSIGTRLLRRVMNIPRLQKVWAEVRRSNVGAQAFYSRLGFQTVGLVPNYYGNEDALIVQWTPSLTQEPH